MQVTFKNIGPLKNVSLDLSNDLIVLCGPNNSGKTYAAYSIYGLYEAIEKRKNEMRTNEEAFVDIFNENDDFTKKIEKTINTKDFFETYLKKSTETLFTKALSTIFSANGNTFAQSECDLFYKDIEYVINYEADCRGANFQKDYNYTYNYHLKYANTENIPHISKDRLYIEIELESNEYLQKNTNLIHFVKSLNADVNATILNLLLYNVLFNKTYNHIFTAERAALVIFNNEIRNFTATKNGDEILLPYPSPISDSLKFLNTMRGYIQRDAQTEFAFLADDLENAILGGVISMSRDGEVQFSPHDNEAKNLSAHLTASLVKSLSTIVLYLRYRAKKNDFIIIDEPELNLHPDNQRLVARFITKLVHHGFKIMISTHSDYIIRELNNLIMLYSGGEKANDLCEKYGYKTDELLDSTRVSAYLFDLNGGAKSLTVDETGFEVATIDVEINKLNQTQEDIFFTLFD